MEKNIYWTSSTNNSEYLLNIHDIDKNITGKDILDIGIGAGHLARYFHSKNNTVFCCDISTAALNNVKNIASVYETDHLKDITPVDLAICNLVFQHCDDTECKRIIQEVNLKKDGICSFQFAYLRDNEEPTDLVKKNIKNKTHYFRSLDTIISFINDSNKKIVNISQPIHYYGEENFSWYIVKITNK